MTFVKNFRHILLYGCILAVLVFILKWLQWKFLIVDDAVDMYAGLIAVFFTVLGMWAAHQVAKPKVVILEKKVPVIRPEVFSINEEELHQLDLSSREYEVLQLLAKGHSNAGIAAELFLSVSTIKTHVSSLFLKMDVKSRTQAMEKAKRLRIIP